MGPAIRIICAALIALGVLAAGPAGAADDKSMLPRSWQILLPEPPSAVQAACCKTCRKGKACGNSCISRAKTCHKPPGCACDAIGKGSWPKEAGGQSFPINARLRGVP